MHFLLKRTLVTLTSRSAVVHSVGPFVQNFGANRVLFAQEGDIEIAEAVSGTVHVYLLLIGTADLKC